MAEGQSATAAILEETPARVVLRTQYHLRPTDSDFLVQADYTVYASGRVAVNMSLQNLSSAARTLGTVEYATTNVEDALSWSINTLNSGNAISFAQTDGATPAPNLLVINASPDTTIATDATGNRYWTVSNQALNVNASFSRQWELQPVPGGQTVSSLTARANDVGAPGVVAAGGAVLVGSGYDFGAGAYTLQESATSLSFYPTSAQQRHAPVFVIAGWRNASWQVSLNGTLLASSVQPQGSTAIVSYDSAGQRLVIQYLDIIPTTSTTAQRTFSVQ